MKNLPSFSLRRILEYFAADDATLQVLKERQARVTVEEKGKQGFYVVPLKPQTDIHVQGLRLRILLKYSADKTMRLTVRDVNARKNIMDLTAPVNEGAGVVNVDYQMVHLRMDFDALH